MKRNLRYWGAHFLGQILLVAVGILVVLYVIIGLNLMGGAAELLQAVANTLPAMVGIAMGCSLLLGNLSAQILYVPLQLTMGDTRKSCYWGYFGYRAAAIAVAVLVSLPAMVLAEPDGIGLDALPALVLALALVSGIGSLAGQLWAKLKVLGMVLIMLVCGSIGGLAGFLSTSETGLAKVQALLRALHGGTGLLAAVAAMVVALDLAFGWLSLRRREVKL